MLPRTVISTSPRSTRSPSAAVQLDRERPRPAHRPAPSRTPPPAARRRSRARRTTNSPWPPASAAIVATEVTSTTGPGARRAAPRGHPDPRPAPRRRSGPPRRDPDRPRLDRVAAASAERAVIIVTVLLGRDEACGARPALRVALGDQMAVPAPRAGPRSRRASGRRGTPPAAGPRRPPRWPPSSGWSPPRTARPGSAPVCAGQPGQLGRARVQSVGVAQPAGVPAHRLLHGRHHGRGRSGPATRWSVAGSALRRQLPVQRGGDPPGEDQPLQQRVRGQPVGPVHAGGGHLAAGVEPGQIGGAVEIGLARRRRSSGRPARPGSDR